VINFRRLSTATVACLGSVALAASTLGAAATPASAQVAAPEVKAAATGFKPKPIRWGKCSSSSLRAAKARCGFLTVPMNYKNPAGRTLQIAVSRVKATAPASKQQGVLIANPGGPGGAGLGLSGYLARVLPAGIASTYDLIGFDPRGVGSSKPALSCIADYSKGPRPVYEPTLGDIPVRSPNENDWLARSKAYADACAAEDGALLPHLGTINAVKDIETLRRALGVRKINYYGFSYGTYLGEVYSTLYPKHTRRMVWDGVVDPREVWYTGQLNQDRAFEGAMNEFWKWVASYNARYGLGDTAAKVETRFYVVQDDLATEPNGELGSSEWNDVFVGAAYYQPAWPDVAAAFAAYVKGNAGPIKAMYSDTVSGDDNGYAMYLAVQCVDAAWPKNYETWRDDAFATATSSPFLTWNNVWYNAPCLFWKAPSRTPLTIKGTGVRALLVNTTLDGATPYAGALEVRKRFKNSVLIAEKGNSTHANSLNGNRCVDSKVYRFLRDGDLPKRKSGKGADVTCKRSPLPKPN
jgi:pimeloyl-ACP methyl ester carboxylesterase